MAVWEMVTAINDEIARLEKARELLGGATAPVKANKQARRPMSEEARERIAAAQRKRWAASKRAAKKAAR